jgi:hypothetical protein
MASLSVQIGLEPHGVAFNDDLAWLPERKPYPSIASPLAS